MTSKFVGLGGGNIMPGSPCDSGYTGARGSTWLGNSLNPTSAGRTRAVGGIGESVRRALVPYRGTERFWRRIQTGRTKRNAEVIASAS